MAKNIYGNAGTKNRALKVRRAAEKRNFQGRISDAAKKDAFDLGTDIAVARKRIELISGSAMEAMDAVFPFLNIDGQDEVLLGEGLRTYRSSLNTNRKETPRDTALQSFYQAMDYKALDRLTSKSSSSKEFMNTNVEIQNEFHFSYKQTNKNSRKYSDILDSIKYFNDNNYGSMSLDLETFGGVDKSGFQRMDMISEYSFNFFDSATGSSSIKPSRSIEGFIAPSANLVEKHKGFVESFRDFGKLSVEEKVAAKNYARYAHPGTVIEEDLSAPGRFLMKSVGVYEDNEITKEKILEGMEKVSKIREKQESVIGKDGLMTHERDFVEAIEEMHKSKRSITGHNLIKADAPWIPQGVADNKRVMSELRKRGVDVGRPIPSERILDTLEIARATGDAQLKEGGIYFKKNIREITENGKFTLFSQDAMGRTVAPDMFKAGSEKAHTASFDTEVHRRILNEILPFSELEIAKRAQLEKNIDFGVKEAGDNTVFYATRSFDRSKMLGFKRRPNGSFITGEGYEISPSGVKKRYPEAGVKKGVSYKINRLSPIESNEELIKTMGIAKPSLATEGLFVMEAEAVIDKSVLGMAKQSTRNNEKHYYVGTMQDFEEQFRGMIPFAKANDDGSFSPLPEGLSMLSSVDGEKRTVSTSSVEEIIEQGTRLINNDPASRSIRANKIGTFKKLETLTESLETIESVLGIPQEETLKGILSGDLPSLPGAEEEVSKIKKILSHEDAQEGTINNLISNLDYYKSVRSEVKPIIEGVEERVKNLDEQQYLFDSAMEILKGEIEETSGVIEKDKVLPKLYEPQSFTLKGLKEKKKAGGKIIKSMDESLTEDALSVSLEPGSEYGLLSALKRFTGVESDTSNIIKVEKLLKDQEILKGKGSYESRLKLGQDTPYTLAQEALEAMRESVKGNPSHGKTSKDFHNVLRPSEMMALGKEGALGKKSLATALEKYNGIKVNKIPLLSQEGSKQALRVQATDIVSNFMMDKFDENKLFQAGYTSSQVKSLKASREVRRKDYVSMMEEVLNMVSESGGKLHASPDFLGFESGGNIYSLDNLPKDRYRGGMFYTEIGGNKYANVLSAKIGESGQAEVSSTIDEAMRSSYFSYGKYDVRNAVHDGKDPAQAILDRISSLAKPLREESSVSALDPQDAKTQFMFNESGIISSLKNAEREVLSIPGMTAKDRKIMEGLIGREGKTLNKYSDPERQVYNKYRSEIAEIITKNTSIETRELIMGATGRGKSSAISRGNIQSQASQYGLELYNNPLRGIEDSTNRTFSFREDLASRRLLRSGVYGSEVRVGSSLKTPLGYGLFDKTSENIGTKVSSEFTAKRRLMTSSQLIEAIDEYRKNAITEKEINLTKRLAMNIHITEGGAAIDPRITDAVYQVADEQRINATRKLFQSHEANTETLEELSNLQKIVPVAEIGDNGEIVFRYQKGRAVKSGQDLISLEGYGGKKDTIKAKYDGVFKMGYFDKDTGALATEKEVRDRVLEVASAKKISIKTAEDFSSEAKSIFSQEFYLEDLFMDPYLKISEMGAEKHMTSALYLGMGDEDKRVSGFLKGLGLEGMEGKILSPSHAESFSSYESFKESVLSDLSTKDISKKAFEALEREHFGNKGGAGEAILSERYELGDLFKRITGASVVLDNPDVKHKNRTSALTSAIETMIQDEMGKVKISPTGDRKRDMDAITSLARKNVVEEIGGAFLDREGKGLYLDDQGRINVPEQNALDGDGIDTKIIRDAYDKRFGEGSYSKILDSGSTSYANYSMMKDSTMMASAGDLPRKELIERDGEYLQVPRNRRDSEILSKSKAVKYTEREYFTSRVDRIGEDAINALSDNYSEDEMLKIFGHAAYRGKEGSFVLEDSHMGRSYLDSYTDAVMNRQHIRAGEAVLTDENVPEYLRSAYELLKASSGGAVGFETAELTNSLIMNRDYANMYNTGKMGMEDMLGAGFKKVNLSEIPSLNEGAGGWFASGIPDNLMVDLSSGVFSEEKLTDMGLPRYVAIGKTPIGVTGEEIVASEPLKKLNTIVMSNERLLDTSHLSDEEYTREVSKFRNAVEDLPDSIAKMVTKKGGLESILSETTLENSFRGKTALIDAKTLMESGMRDIFKDAKVGDMALTDLYDRDIGVDFKVISREHIEKLGYLNEEFLSERGVSADDVLDIFRSGVTTVGKRYPLDYKGSVRPQTLILSDYMKGGGAFESAVGAITGHADADGDTSDTVIPTIIGKDGKSTSMLDYEITKIKAKRGDEAALEAMSSSGPIEDMELIKKDLVMTQHKNAILVNRAVEKDLLSDDLQKRIAENTADMLEDRDLLRPSVSRMLSPKEMAQNEAMYREVEGRALGLRARELGGDSYEEFIPTAKEEFLKDPKIKRNYMLQGTEGFGEESETYRKAMHLYESGIENLAASGAKVKQASAGQINLPIMEMKKLATFAPDNLFSSNERTLLANTFEIAESYLSPKHSSAELLENVDMITEFIRSLNAASGKPMRGDKAGTDLLEQFFLKHGQARVAPDVLEIYGDKETAMTEGARLWGRLLDQVDTGSKKKVHSALSQVGVWTEGISAKAMSDIAHTAVEDASPKSRISNLGRDLTEVSLVGGYRSDEALSMAADRVSTGYRPPGATGMREVLEEIGASMGSGNIRGRDLALGAIGIAGALMAVGFVGGNPSKPAEAEAQNMPEGQYYDEGAPILSDEGLEIYNNGGSKGYIININANSRRGKKYVEQAIQQAMANSYDSTNINISMNTRDSSGNITDRNIEEIIRGSFG